MKDATDPLEVSQRNTVEHIVAADLLYTKKISRKQNLAPEKLVCGAVKQAAWGRAIGHSKSAPAGQMRTCGEDG